MIRLLKVIFAVLCGFYVYRLYDKVKEPWRFFIFAVPMTTLVVVMHSTADPVTFGFCVTTICWLVVSRAAYLYIKWE